MPVVHIIEENGYGEGIENYFQSLVSALTRPECTELICSFTDIVEPGLKFSRRFYWGVARDDPRLADIDVYMKCAPYRHYQPSDSRGY